MREVSIEPATDAELAVGLALLPPVAHPDSQVFIARAPDGELVGAAGIAWQSWGDPPGFPAWAHVLPDRRRAGVGRQLAARLATAAVGETPALWVATPLDEACESAAFARAVGFAPVKRQFFFRANTSRFAEFTSAIAARLENRRRIPAGARAQPLDSDQIDDIATLVLSEVRGASSTIARDLRGAIGCDPTTAPVDLTRSLILCMDHAVIGALLTRRMPDSRNTQIIARAIAPAYRKGWANALLIDRTTQLLLRDGCEWFDFDCAEDLQDTIGLARRGDAGQMRTNSLYYQAVAKVSD